MIEFVPVQTSGAHGSNRPDGRIGLKQVKSDGILYPITVETQEFRIIVRYTDRLGNVSRFYPMNRISALELAEKLLRIHQESDKLIDSSDSIREDHLFSLENTLTFLVARNYN